MLPQLRRVAEERAPGSIDGEGAPAPSCRHADPDVRAHSTDEFAEPSSFSGAAAV